MTETRKSAGMVVNDATGAMMPCRLEVVTADNRPLDLETPSPVADGRYKLLAPGWQGDAVRVNGAWEISNLKVLKPAPVSSEERQKAARDIDKATAHNPVLNAAAKAALRAESLQPDDNAPKRKWRLF